MKTIALIIFSTIICCANANASEESVLKMLYSGDFYNLQAACRTLPKNYPDSLNAIKDLRGILRSNEVMIFTITEAGPNHGAEIKVPAAHAMVVREVARALGNYHITPTDEDLSIIFNQLVESHDTDTAMDGLKALRGMNAPNAVPMLIPLLEDGNVHVLRDTIRTLGVLGDESTIKHLEPFMHYPRIDVVSDAEKAIKSLKAQSIRNRAASGKT
jgi:hypothetical protein